MNANVPPLNNLNIMEVGTALVHLIATGYPMSGAGDTSSLAQRRLGDPDSNHTPEERFVHDVLTEPLATVYDRWARGVEPRPEDTADDAQLAAELATQRAWVLRHDLNGQTAPPGPAPQSGHSPLTTD